jgi:site-specific DNA recombinase
MMLAAVYARKSTDQGGISDEEKSVRRQIDHARAYAAKKGWAVTEEHVYVDDGISGAEFIKRPGLARLMNALVPRPPFQILIMSEESRLGREQIETAYLLKQITDADVRVFFYLEDRERTLDNALDKVMLSLTTFAAEVEREKGSQRTYDAMARKARALHVTGGKVYGYDNVEVLSSEGRRLHVLRRINLEQAAVVRRIFEMCASGLGLTRIAKALNADGVQPPRHAAGWAPSAIREMLYRPLYKGELIWGKHQKIMRGGTKKLRRRPEAEWFRLRAPELQMIPSETWESAHARLDLARAAFARSPRDGRLLVGRPAGRDFDSPYLLSGIAKCASCGDSLVGITRDLKRTRSAFYGCDRYHKRGSTVCRNSLLIRQEHLDQVVLQAIADVLEERILAQAVAKALERLRGGQGRVLDRQTGIERELSLLETHVGHLVDAVARGEANDALFARLRSEEARKKTLVAELAALQQSTAVASLDGKRLERELTARGADVKGLLGRHVPQTRQILRKLIVGRLTCEAFEEGGQRGYRFTGQGTYEHLLPGKLVPTMVVTPAGFEPAISTLKGSAHLL